MGYSTNFRGQLQFDKTLTKDMLEAYKNFKQERHEDGYKPNGKPSIWLGWEITKNDRQANYYLEWDGGEKFYNYTEWLEYIIKYVFKVWGVKLNGQIDWRGDEWEDNGTIIVKDNTVVAVPRHSFTYPLAIDSNKEEIIKIINSYIEPSEGVQTILSKHWEILINYIKIK